MRSGYQWGRGLAWDAMGILTERVEIPAPGGGPIGAYLARPAGDSPRPGVLVAHELFGVTTHVREVCERIAALGFRALAPDLYRRISPGAELPHDAAGRARGFELLHTLRRDPVVDDVRAAAEHLRAAGDTRVGMVGLSLGGHVAYLAAARLELAAVAALYPGWLAGTEIGLSRPEPTLSLTPAIRARTLILFGGADHAIAEGEQASVASALARAGVRHEVVTYPDTPHGFLCDRRDTFAPAAAADAWRRIEALLVKELG